MKRAVIKLLFPVFIATFICSVFYYRIEKLFVASSEVIPKMSYILNTTEKNDIIVIGSSRAYFHFDPRIIDSVCGAKTYNLGINGSAIVEQNMVLNTYLQYHPSPEVVLINVDFLDFDSKMVVYNSLDYMPYLKLPEVKSCIGSYAHYKYAFLAPLLRLQRVASVPNDEVKLSAFYASDDRLLTIFKESGEEKYYGESYKGYQENNAPLESDAKDPVIKVQVKYDDQGLNILNGMIQLCKSRSITPVLVYCPLYYTYVKKFNGVEPLMNKVAAIAKQNNISYLDYSRVAYNTDSSCFYNITHLNGKGSRLFSTQLANDLKAVHSFHE